MRELSLFAGAGGGLLAGKLLGWTLVGAVEWEDYAQRVLAQRQADGHLDRCPIFGDVAAFVRDGYARRYRGVADVVSAGWPCQPHSVAGKRLADEDERDRWPDVMAVLREVRPRFFFGENVPGILTSRAADGSRYFDRVVTGLAELGFVGRYGIVGANDAGAPHRRKRLWIVAHRDRG